MTKEVLWQADLLAASDKPHGWRPKGAVRGKHYVQPRGYAAPPGTGPKGETCGTCRFKIRHQPGSKSYQKCDHPHGRVKHTGGRGSDILVSAPACREWKAKEEYDDRNSEGTVRR